MNYLRAVRRRADAYLGQAFPGLAAILDWARPSAHAALGGGPMNGQEQRRAITRGVLHRLQPQAVVETGTCRGGTTMFLADVAGCPVHTVELSPRFSTFARWKLGHRPDVHLASEDSRVFLRRLSTSPDVPKERVFFYLDAHWEDDLPLREELDIIAGSWANSVVMIDDFQVPGDADYGYDDYGDVGALTVDLLPPSTNGWSRYFPSLPGRLESGASRGCIVLSNGVELGSVEGLRRIDTSPTQEF